MGEHRAHRRSELTDDAAVPGRRGCERRRRGEQHLLFGDQRRGVGRLLDRFRRCALGFVVCLLALLVPALVSSVVIFLNSKPP